MSGMDSLNDILQRKDFEEPPEVAAIKRFVQDKFHSDVGVSVKPSAISIACKSAALAGSLRMVEPELRRAAQTTSRLVFRIG